VALLRGCLGIFKFLLLLLLSSSAFGADNYVEHDPNAPYDYYAENYDSPYAIGIPTKTPITIDDLYGAIKSLPNPSIESLLPVLQKQEPEMFNEYVLMYGSRSLQGSSFQAPRALLIGKHAELVITFNGNASQKGFNTLEVMYFDHKESKFNFQEITFDQGKVGYSALNAKKCLACHQSSTRGGADPRPNWEPYNVWPGAYHSVSGISQVIDKTYVPNSVLETDGTYGVGDPAGSHYSQFLTDQRALEESEGLKFVDNVLPTHPRYKYLVPYEKSGTGSYVSLFDFGSAMHTANNETTRFTQSLAVLNARRVGRMIQKNYPEIFARYKYAMLAAAKCYVLPLPDDVKAWHKARLAEQNLPEQNVADYKQINRLEQAFDFIFKAYGIDTSDWTMDFNTGGTMASNDRWGIPGGFAKFNPAVTGGLQEAWQLEEFDEGDDNCNALIYKSMEVLSQPAALPHYGEIDKSRQPLINRCISCHAEGGIAPFIPFDDPKALKAALQKNNGQLAAKIHYRLGPFPKFGDAMPLNGYATLEQKAQVLKYIDSLL